ncbi:hypothetical protein BY996DRAFT_6538315 [Phakopsora pachyrhizi]|nr:hypothetical protein BY996DRAFT_6538315 [Phakopsora pachyrhizi]
MHTYLPTSSSFSGYPPFCMAFVNSNHYVVLHFKKVNSSIPAPPIDVDVTNIPEAKVDLSNKKLTSSDFVTTRPSSSKGLPQPRPVVTAQSTKSVQSLSSKELQLKKTVPTDREPGLAPVKPHLFGNKKPFYSSNSFNNKQSQATNCNCNTKPNWIATPFSTVTQQPIKTKPDNPTSVQQFNLLPKQARIFNIVQAAFRGLCLPSDEELASNYGYRSTNRKVSADNIQVQSDRLIRKGSAGVWV